MSVGKGSLVRAAKTGEVVAKAVVAAPEEQVAEAVIPEKKPVKEKKAAVKKTVSAKKAPSAKKTAAVKKAAPVKKAAVQPEDVHFIHPKEQENVVSHLYCELPTFLL
jgi:microcompartment protein CcmL/EutN